jgi:trehalose-6-phosphate synthase
MGRFAVVQAAATSRSKLDSYRQLQQTVRALAAEINARHTAGGIVPSCHSPFIQRMPAFTWSNRDVSIVAPLAVEAST